MRRLLLPTMLSRAVRLVLLLMPLVFPSVPQAQSIAAKALYDEGHAHFQDGRYAEAAEMFRAVIALDPRAGPAHFFLGNAYAKLGRVEEARASFKLALEYAVNDTQRQAVRRELNALQTAAPAGVAEDMPDSARVRFVEGTVLFQEGRYAEAAEKFKTVTVIHPQAGPAYFFLGRAYAKLGRFGAAKASFTKALELAINDQQREASRRELAALPPPNRECLPDDQLWRLIYNQRPKYEGECVDGKPQGRGKLIGPGLTYEGEFHEGKRHGSGVQTLFSGTRYEGEFRDDARSGRGTYTNSQGERYEGQWLDDQPHGQGKLTRPDGTVLEGIWTRGCLRQGNRRTGFPLVSNCGS